MNRSISTSPCRRDVPPGKIDESLAIVSRPGAYKMRIERAEP